MKTLYKLLAIGMVLGLAFTALPTGQAEAQTGPTVVTDAAGLTTALADSAVTAIELGADIDASSVVGSAFVIPSGKTVTLDLNGHTISAETSNGGVFSNAGTLTILDNSVVKGGKIINTNTTQTTTGEVAKSAISNTGVLIVNAGVIVAGPVDGHGSWGDDNFNPAYGIDNLGAGKVTVNGATISGAYGLRNFANQPGTTITITDGIVTGKTGIAMQSFGTNDGTLTINGDTIVTATGSAIYAAGVTQYNHIVINGGTFSGEDEYGTVCVVDGTLDINGGTFTGNNDTYSLINYYAIVNVTAGTFNGDIYGGESAPDAGYEGTGLTSFAPSEGAQIYVNGEITGNVDGVEHVVAPVHNVTKNTYFSTIQAAIDAASAGDTINVAAGTYVEQVVINKSLTLQGTGSPTIKAPVAPTAFTFPESGAIWEPVVFAFGGTADAAHKITGTATIQVAISGFTVDGNNRTPAGRSAGILLRNVEGTISGNTVQNMSIDGKETFGIIAYGDSYVTITGNNVSGYARTGIGANGDVGDLPDPHAVITDNIVTGPGMDVPVTWAPNGIQIGYGATGEISGNTVSANGWPGEEWTGSGILVHASEGVEVDGNAVEYNETGIAVSGASSNTSIHDNTVDVNKYGISIQDYVVNTTIEDNIVKNSTYDGIDICNFYGTPPTGTVIQSNTITGNNTEDDDTSGGIWIADDVDGDEVNVHLNNIVGNNRFGILNTSTIDEVDASPNWWGSVAGPAAGQIVGNVTYIPWCGDADCSFLVYLAGSDLQASIDDTPAGGTLYVPVGTYTGGGSDGYNVAGKTIILGDGVIIQNSSPCFTVTASHTKITTESIGGAMCVPTNNSNGIDVAAELTNIIIEGLEINGTSQTTGSGIHFVGVITDVILRDNFIHNLGGDGVHFTAQPTGYVEIKGNLFMGNAGEGVDNASGTSDIDAKYNAWGDYAGPAGTNGDGVSANVTSSPWTHVDVDVQNVAASSRYAGEVAVGETITYNVVANLQNAYGAQFTLTYNPAKLDFISVGTTDTVFPSLWTGSTDPVASGVTVDEANGKITFAGGAASAAVNGEDQFLFSVTFTGLDDTPDPNPLSFAAADEALFGMNPGYGSSLNIYAAGMAGVADVNVYDLPTLSISQLDNFAVGNPKEFSLTVSNPATGRAYTNLDVDLSGLAATLEYYNGSAWVTYTQGTPLNTGRPLNVGDSATVDFKVTFNAAGTDTATVNVYDGTILLVTDTFDFTVLNSFTVTGSVQMQGRTVRSGVPVTLTATAFGPYNAVSIDLISDNLSFLNVAEGTYTITTNQPRYLNVTGKTVAISSAKTSLTRLELKGGNAVWENDNKIDILDAVKVGATFGTAGEGDVNFDGKVNVQDLALVGGNYGLTSAVYESWTP